MNQITEKAPIVLGSIQIGTGSTLRTLRRDYGYGRFWIVCSQLDCRVATCPVAGLIDSMFGTCFSCVTA